MSINRAHVFFILRFLSGELAEHFDGLPYQLLRHHLEYLQIESIRTSWHGMT